MEKNNPLRKLVKRDCRKAMLPTAIVYTVGDLLGSILTVYTAGILGSFADAVLNLDMEGGMNSFWLLLFCLAVNLFVVPLIGMIGEVIMFGNSLRHERYCVGRFLDKMYENVSAMEPGESQYRISDDPTDLRCDWVELVENLVIIPVTLVYLLYSSLRISVLFTVLTLSISALKLVVPAVTKKTLAKYKIKDKQYKTTLRAYEMEMTEKPHMIRLYGMKKAVIARLDRLYMEYFHKVVKKNSRYKTIADSILSMLDTVCVLLILFVGALMVSFGAITAGGVAAMVGYFGIYNTLISKIDSMIRTFPNYQNDIERVTELYSHEEKQEGESIGDACIVEAKDLGFCYAKQPVFRDVAFSVRKGDKFAITGANGSGKSTLILLLCGLLGNYTGSIKINGRELRALNPQAWRKHFAFVQQDPYLFEGSVMENIRIGNPAAGEEEIKAVMEKLGILYLADRIVAAHDRSLSGGEMQRISIARALLKGSSLLIFDEPSNNLDADTTKWIADFIRECEETVIFITHDQALKQVSDHVLCLE